jgi:hypothetical protein
LVASLIASSPSGELALLTDNLFDRERGIPGVFDL